MSMFIIIPNFFHLVGIFSITILQKSLCVGTTLSSDGGESKEYVKDDDDDDTDERSALLEVDPVAAQKP